MENNILKVEKEINVRFSEVDSMNIVWHGSYALYFEDAREAFGAKYGLGYLDIASAGYYAPLIDLRFEYKKPLIYGDKALIEITYRNTQATKIIFDYKIISKNNLITTGYSIQVFLDKQYQLLWSNPEFYEKWKMKNGLL